MQKIIIIKMRKYSFILIACLLFICTNLIFSQNRKEINIPNIPGYLTLKCDFHIHTVFSDGEVWPTIRVLEAWEEGLDCIALSDHIEKYHNNSDVIPDDNKPYQLALPYAKKYDILLIKGAEISMDDPVGHINAIFLNDIKPLNKPEYHDVLSEAKRQGAFIFWNHPGWESSDCSWGKTQTEILEKGWMNGIEIVNTNTFYPNVHKWVTEKNLTMMCNSDIHSPIKSIYDFEKGEHRPVTLVFAKDRSLNSIKEALFAGRTAAYFKNTIIGKEEYLKPLFNQAVKLKTSEIILRNDNSFSIQINNSSDIDYELVYDDKSNSFDFQKTVILPKNKTVILDLTRKGKIEPGENMFKIPFIVKNLWVEPEKGMPVEFIFKAYSFNGISIIPEALGDNKKFKVNLPNLTKDLQLYYTIDGTEPGSNSMVMDKPFEAAGQFTLKSVIYKNGIPFSEIIEKNVNINKAIGKKITIKNQYQPKYSAGGPDGLVNGFTGSTEFADGNWQGYEKDDLEAVIDLGKETELKKVRINFLQDINSWIFLPVETEIYISGDGKNYEKMISEKMPVPNSLSPKMIYKFEGDMQNRKCRYIKVFAKNVALCPGWHKGAGGKAWIFADEIIAE
jgi:3',5'-nucleoside bisphosphate phosphatase